MTDNPWNNNDFTHPRKTPWWSSRVLLIIILAVAVFVGLIIFWNLIISHTDDVDEENIPVIAAETLTIKERPQEAIVEEGDSVYSLISQEKSKASSLKTDEEDPVYETSFQQSNEGEVVSPKAIKEEKVEIIEMNTPLVLEPKKESGRKEKSGTFFLQIGSLPSEHQAQQESQRLKKKHKLLKRVDITIVPKELAGKGIYHRIHAGPFESKKEADTICQQLIQAGAHCLRVG